MHEVIARFGAFEVDSGPRQLTRDGKPIHLTPKAFDFLLLLIEEAPHVIRKDELHSRLWPDTFVVDATLVSIVKQVRRALDDNGAISPIIRTAHRVGYAFAAPVDRAVMPDSDMSRWLVVGPRRIGLTGIEHLIGRDPASSVHLDAAGVSRRHARILVRGRDAVLEDLGSKNGTAVNGRPLEGSVTLKDDDEIRIGPVVILFKCSAHGQSTETVGRSASGMSPSRDAAERCHRRDAHSRYFDFPLVRRSTRRWYRAAVRSVTVPAHLQLADWIEIDRMSVRFGRLIPRALVIRPGVPWQDRM